MNNGPDRSRLVVKIIMVKIGRSQVPRPQELPSTPAPISWPHRVLHAMIEDLAHITGCVFSGANSTYTSRVAGAYKYAFFTSCTIIFVFCDHSWDEAHPATEYLKYSIIGVAANKSGRLSLLKSVGLSMLNP